MLDVRLSNEYVAFNIGFAQELLAPVGPEVGIKKPKLFQIVVTAILT